MVLLWWMALLGALKGAAASGAAGAAAGGAGAAAGAGAAGLAGAGAAGAATGGGALTALKSAGAGAGGGGMLPAGQGVMAPAAGATAQQIPSFAGASSGPATNMVSSGVGVPQPPPPGAFQQIGRGFSNTWDQKMRDLGIRPDGPDDKRPALERISSKAFDRMLNAPGQSREESPSRPSPLATRPVQGSNNRPVGRRTVTPRPAAPSSPMLATLDPSPRGFDAGYFEQGGSFRVPMIPSDEQEVPITLHATPGEMVTVKPTKESRDYADANEAYGRGEGSDASLPAAMPYNEIDSTIYDAPQQPFLDDEDWIKAGRGSRLRAGTMAVLGGNIGYYGRSMDRQQTENVRNRVGDLLREKMERTGARQWTPLENEQWARLRSYHSGERAQVAAQRQGAGFEYRQGPKGYAERQQIDPYTGEPTGGGWMRVNEPQEQHALRHSIKEQNAARTAVQRRNEYLNDWEPEDLRKLSEVADMGDQSAVVELKRIEDAFAFKDFIDGESPEAEEAWLEQRAKLLAIMGRGKKKGDPKGSGFFDELEKVGRDKASKAEWEEAMNAKFGGVQQEGLDQAFGLLEQLRGFTGGSATKRAGERYEKRVKRRKGVSEAWDSYLHDATPAQRWYENMQSEAGKYDPLRDPLSGMTTGFGRRSAR